MKKINTVISIIITISLFSGCASVNMKSEKFSKINIAVLPFLTSDKEISSELTRKLASKISEITSFRVTDPELVDSIVKAERFKDLRGLSYRNRLKEISRMVNARYIIIGKISVSKDLTISDSSRKIFNIGDGPLVMYGIKIIMIDAEAGKTISEAKCLSNDKHMDISRRMVLKKTLAKYIAEEFPDLINELISGASDNF